MKFLRKSPLSPFILTLYAVLSLWVVNYDQTPFISVVRVLVLTLVIALITLLLLRIILCDWVKAGLAASLALLIFFVYGHVYNLILGREIAGIMIGRHRYLLVVVGILFGVGLFFIIRKQKKAKEINLWVNIITLLMLAMVGVQTGSRLMQLGKANRLPEVEPTASEPEDLGSTSIGDVYYIVMDSYSRQELLFTEFGLDNTEFITELEEMGFVVPDCTLSNYDATQYSLASSLNMNYLEDLDISSNGLSGDSSAADYYSVIRESKVRNKFEDMGYQFVTFKSLYPFLNIADSDIFYDVDSYQPFYNQIESINFQDLFFRTTLMRILIDAQDKGSDSLNILPDFIVRLINPRASRLTSREYRLYDQYEFALEKLQALPDIPGRKFVYAHLFITHPPFVFQVDGRIRDSFEDSGDAYRDQVVFASEQLLEIIQSIIENSSQPPVIVIQADHAYRVLGENRVKILNAYYLPKGGNKLVYPSITPVNTFRLIFNYYFDEEFNLLPDHSFHRETPNESDTTFIEASGSCIK